MPLRISFSPNDKILVPLFSLRGFCLSCEINFLSSFSSLFQPPRRPPPRPSCSTRYPGSPSCRTTTQSSRRCRAGTSTTFRAAVAAAGTPCTTASWPQSPAGPGRTTPSTSRHQRPRSPAETASMAVSAGGPLKMCQFRATFVLIGF